MVSTNQELAHYRGMEGPSAMVEHKCAKGYCIHPFYDASGALCSVGSLFTLRVFAYREVCA